MCVRLSPGIYLLLSAKSLRPNPALENGGGNVGEGVGESVECYGGKQMLSSGVITYRDD